MFPHSHPCPTCNGSGAVLDKSRPVTEYDLPQYLRCQRCNGTGDRMEEARQRMMRRADRVNADNENAR